MSFHIRRSLNFYLFFIVNCTIFFSVNTDVRPFLLDNFSKLFARFSKLFIYFVAIKNISFFFSISQLHQSNDQNHPYFENVLCLKMYCMSQLYISCSEEKFIVLK